MHSKSDKVLTVAAYILTSIFVLVIILPVLYMASLSLQDDNTVYSYPPSIIPPPSKSISIVLDYSNYEDKTEKELEDIVLRDSTVAMYSTIYELNRTVIGEIKVYGTKDGKTIYYSRAHSMMLRLEQQYGIYKKSSVTPKVLFFDNRYLTSVKDIGYAFDIEGVDASFNGAELGQTEISGQIKDNFEGEYSVSGKYRGAIVKSSLLLVLENYKYYFLMPTYAYGHYENIKQFSFLAFLFNTVITIVWAVLCQVVLCSLTAYPLSRLLSKKVADRVLLFFLITLMIPWVCIMVPQFIMIKGFGMYNQMSGMLFPWLLPAPFYIFLFKGFFDRIPSAYFEAAKIDGSSELNTFLRICMPMSKPIITLIAMQSFISGWGDFMWYHLIANKPDLWTINVAIYTIGAVKGAVVRQNFLMGLSFVSIVPILLITAIFSKQIKASFMSSGVKG